MKDILVYDKQGRYTLLGKVFSVDMYVQLHYGKSEVLLM